MKNLKDVDVRLFSKISVNFIKKVISKTHQYILY